MKSLGKRLKELREKRKLSQKRAAEIFDLTNTQLSRYENDVHSPDPDLLRKFADYYEVTTDYLLGRTNDPAPLKHDGTEDVYTADEEFLKFVNDPELERWFKELPKSKEEDLRKLRKMWEIIKSEEN